jgi:hypothetical protein
MSRSRHHGCSCEPRHPGAVSQRELEEDAARLDLELAEEELEEYGHDYGSGPIMSGTRNPRSCAYCWDAYLDGRGCHDGFDCGGNPLELE